MNPKTDDILKCRYQLLKSIILSGNTENPTEVIDEVMDYYDENLDALERSGVSFPVFVLLECSSMLNREECEFWAALV